MGALVVTVVVVVQALLFADGGIVALGLNVLNLSLVTALGGWVAFRLMMRILPKSTGGAIAATMVAGFLSYWPGPSHSLSSTPSGDRAAHRSPPCWRRRPVSTP